MGLFYSALYVCFCWVYSAVWVCVQEVFVNSEWSFSTAYPALNTHIYPKTLCGMSRDCATSIAASEKNLFLFH